MGRRRHRLYSLFASPSISFLSLLFLLSSFAYFSNVNAKANATKGQASVTPINRDLYHTSGALLEEIESLVHRHPDKLSIETFSSKNRGYQAETTIVTYCQGGKDCDDRSKVRILLTFGQHGRELITTELALRILSILSDEEFLPKQYPLTLNNTLDKLVIKIVPMENVNGRKLVEKGELCERRNGRGVDLNRNWSVDWGKKEKDYDPYEENPGTSPFSEPETQLMRKLSTSFEPHIWVNVHSGMEALFMPYDHKNTTPDGFLSQRMRMMLEKLNHFHLNDRCLVGSGGGSVGYLAHGTATDYMYDIVRVPMAFTFEIYGDPEASSKDCFKMFNPTSMTTFNKVLNEWSAVFFTMFSISAHQIDEFHSNASASSSFEKWVSIDDYLNGYLMERRSRYGKKMEVLELGMQEIRTYFRLFLLSSVLLLFMFCSRISKSSRQIVSAMPF
ncbi:metallocarboxypeptidase A-like protein MCYG_01475 [Ipomoea triloba]|uniref:metallocarboxypeptidase A-like protein MCYG_01475 n=1 Tax=Ipomoea triloba TaxID=35885 RepID=UPI00125CF49E|nr:metallocarboxypeptidase A-like protein MCYG_01475 [Ipomoea triloba]